MGSVRHCRAFSFVQKRRGRRQKRPGCGKCGGEVKEFAVGDELLSSSSFFSSKQYEVELIYEGGATKTIYIDAEADEFTFSAPSVVSYSEQKGTGLMQGTRKTWRASAPGETDMILKTALGEFVWKIKIV